MSLALFRVFKSLEQLSFDSLVETNVVRLSPNTAKVFVSAPGGNRSHIYMMCVCVCICMNRLEKRLGRIKFASGVMCRRYVFQAQK